MIGSDLAKIGDGSLRIFDLHALRNTAKAVLTSFSVAASPASPSSIAANSSSVALYWAPASSASISSASSAGSCCRSFGQVSAAVPILDRYPHPNPPRQAGEGNGTES